MSEQGYIYVLFNPAMKELVKIGRTKRFSEDRAGELSRATGVPAEFHVVYDELFEDVSKAEQMIHNKLDEYRYSHKREFFKIPVKQAIRTIIRIKQLEKTYLAGLANAMDCLFAITI